MVLSRGGTHLRSLTNSKKLFDALKTSSPTDDCNACCDDCITGQDVSTNDFDIGIHRYSPCSWKTAKAVDVIRAIIESRQTASDIWKDMPLNELMSLSNYVLLSLIPNTHTHALTHARVESREPSYQRYAAWHASFICTIRLAKKGA